MPVSKTVNEGSNPSTPVFSRMDRIGDDLSIRLLYVNLHEVSVPSRRHAGKQFKLPDFFSGGRYGGGIPGRHFQKRKDAARMQGLHKPACTAGKISRAARRMSCHLAASLFG